MKITIIESEETDLSHTPPSGRGVFYYASDAADRLDKMMERAVEKAVATEGDHSSAGTVPPTPPPPSPPPHHASTLPHGASPSCTAGGGARSPLLGGGSVTGSEPSPPPPPPLSRGDSGAARQPTPHARPSENPIPPAGQIEGRPRQAATPGNVEYRG